MDLSNGIHYFSLLDGSGYGDAAAQYIDGFVARGIAVKWTPLLPTPLGLLPAHLAPSRYRDQIELDIPRRRTLMQLVDTPIQPDLLFLHAMPELFSSILIPDTPRVGYTVWETSDLPDHWPAHLEKVDHLLVPCRFNQSLFEVPDGPDVSVIPHIIRDELASADENRCRTLRGCWQIQDSTWVFYNISSWSPRKALWETLHAYLLAFTSQDDVCLILKTDELGQDLADPTNKSHKPVRNMVDEIVSAYPDPPRVLLIDTRLDEQDIHALHHIGDCFFSLTHSEGWGLGAFDAATAGNAVIITGWGGQLDYLPADSALLVDYQLRSVSKVAQWESYTENQNWAEADIDHGITQLQHAYGNQQEMRLRGANLQAFVHKHFNSTSVMGQLIDVIASW